MTAKKTKNLDMQLFEAAVYENQIEALSLKVGVV
jgi:hypothetical protein